jgi:hypothetical protein
MSIVSDPVAVKNLQTAMMMSCEKIPAATRFEKLVLLWTAATPARVNTADYTLFPDG